MLLSSAWSALSLASFLLGLATPSSAVELRQLTSDTFESSIQKGAWFVEHFSPQCGHCRAFAPTWEALAEEKQSLEGIAGFHMAQVNCLAQGDLCDANGVKAYPSFFLYEDGVKVEPFTGSRNKESMSEYIDAAARSYAKRLPGAPLVVNSNMKNARGASAGGSAEVRKITTAEEVAELKKTGGFIKFFAPWCGHCKNLAPIWVELAGRHAGKMTIAELDCEAHHAICKAEGIMGYPQLYLYANGQKYEYNGQRSLDALDKFATKALSNGELEHITSEDIIRIARKEEVFFVYLHTYGAPKKALATVMAANRALIGSAIVYQSRDPDVFSHTGVQPTPGEAVLLCFKDHTSSPPIAILSLTPTKEGKEKLEEEATVLKFLEFNKLPTVVELSGANFKDVMRNKRGSLVVLAGLPPVTNGNMHKRDQQIAELKQVATAWRKGGRPFKQGVIFAWMDGGKWAKWLKQNYGMKTSKMPEVVVADPINSEYYDITLELEKLQFNGAAIFSTLEGIYQKFIKARTVEGLSARLLRALALKIEGWHESASTSPFTFVVICVAIAVVGLALIRKCVQMDFPTDQAAHKLTNRMD